MKRLILSILVVASLAVSACGGSSKSQPVNAQQKVRDTYYHVLSAFTSSTPSDGCRYYSPASNDKCLSGIMVAKMFHTQVSSMIPINWQERLAKAKVVVTGNKATIGAVVTQGKKHTRFVLVDGQWFLDASR